MMLGEYYVILIGQDTGENEDEEYLRSLVRSGEDRFFLLLIYGNNVDERIFGKNSTFLSFFMQGFRIFAFSVVKTF